MILKKKFIELAGVYSSKLLPMHIMLELTNKCNCKCIHCYIEKEQLFFLPVSKIKILFDSLKKMGCFKITFTGGEFFEHPDYFDIIRLTEEFGFIYTIFSNGFSVDESLLKYLNKSTLFRSFHLSIYGISDKTNDMITATPGSLKKLMSTIELLKKYNLEFILKTALMKPNFNEWEDVMNFCSKNRYTHAFEFMLFPSETGKTHPMKYALDKNELVKINSIFRDKYKKKLYLKVNRDREAFLNEKICVAGKNKLAVSYRGDVFPCLLLRKPAGNIFNDKIEDIWYNSNWLKELRNVRNRDIQGCGSCDKIEYCKFKCPGISQLFYGTIYRRPESRCLIADINFEMAGCGFSL